MAENLRRVREYDDPVALGVHPARRVAGGPGPGGEPAALQPAYLPRDVTGEVTAALERGGLVVLDGPAACGKSRLAFEAMHQARPDDYLIVPRSGAELRELDRAGAELPHPVIWLDGAERHLSSGALDALVRSAVLAPGGPRATVLVTLNAAWREEVSWYRWVLQRTDGPFPDPTRTVVRLAAELSANERALAEQRRDDPWIAAFLEQREPGLAAHIAGAREALDRWNAVLGQRHPGGAIVAAAVYARCAGHLGPLPRPLLAELSRQILDADGRPRDGSQEFEQGLAWAVAAAVPGTRGCLVPLGDDHWQPLDYLAHDLVRRMRRGDLHREDVFRSTAFRQALLDYVSPDEARLVGAGWLTTRGESRAVSERALRLAADTGDQVAMDELGRLYRAGGRVEEAEHWYRRAAQHGCLPSLAALGSLHADQEQEPSEPTRDDLRLLYRAGYAHVDFEIIWDIADLLRNGMEDLETCYRLGAYLDDLSEYEVDPCLSPVPWLRRAAEAGHVRAMDRLASILAGDGEVGAAARLYRLAIARGHTVVAEDLQRLLAEAEPQ